MRFSRNQAGEDAFRDAQDGILVNVSVGYMIHNVERDVDAEVDTFRVNDWEPMEISLVSVPADPSVGLASVGRSQVTESPENPANEVNPMSETGNNTQATEQPVETRAAEPQRVEIDFDKERAAIRDNELKRISEIEAVGEQFGMKELARQFINENKDANEFRTTVLEELSKRPGSGVVKTQENPEIGMTGREVENYSLARAIIAYADKDWSKAGLEREASLAVAERTGKDPKGFYMPFDVARAPVSGQRDLVVGTPTAGGHLVATDLLTASFIDLLYKAMMVRNLGATVLGGLVGNVAIPRQTGGATAYWVTEGNAPTESLQAVDQVTLTPHTVGAFTQFSRRLLLQSSLDIEMFVRMDLARTLALAVDLAAIAGTNSGGQPKGILSTSGIGSKEYANAGNPTWANIVQMETEVATDNALMGSLAYLTTAAMRGTLKTVEKANTTGQFIWTDAGVNGYRAEVSNQVTAGYAIFGNWTDLLIGEWSGTDILVNPYAADTAGGMRVTALQDIDVAVRHAESFCELKEAAP